MISLTLPTALLIYLFVTTLAILGWWLREHWKLRNKHLILEEEQLTTCEFCHYAYLAPKIKPVSRCPQCSSFNKSKNG